MPDKPTLEPDPVVTKSLSVPLMVSTLILSLSLVWALYDEVYTMRPWKGFQSDFLELYSAHLEKLKPQQARLEKQIKESPEYQDLQKQLDEAEAAAREHSAEIDRLVRQGVTPRMIAARQTFQILRTEADAQIYLLETASNEELADSFSDVAGKRYYAEGGLSGLSITGPGWGYSIFANAVADIAVNNPTVPFFDVRVYGQIGALTGVGYSLMDYELDVGVAIKVVRRIGVQRTFHIVDFAPALKGEFDDLIDSGSDVTAYAPDAGVIYHYDRYHDFPLKFAAVAQNIGGLDFDKAGEVPMTINVGASTEVEMLGFDVTFAADELDLLGAQDTERDKSYVQDLKLGVEAGLFKLFNGHHLVSFRFGRNGVYNAFGFSLNVFGLKIDYAQWSEEVGSFAGSQEDQRQAIKITLIF